MSEANGHAPVERVDAGELLGAIRSALYNESTGMGTGISSLASMRVGHTPLLTEQQIRSLYRSSWLIRRIIDVPAQDMTRKSLEVKILGDGDQEMVAGAMKLYRDSDSYDSPFLPELSLDKAKEQAIKWARKFGRAYIVCRLNRGEDPSKPLTRVRSFDGVVVLDKYQLIPATSEQNRVNPEFYEVWQGDRAQDCDYKYGQRIHCSRVIPYDGNEIHPYDIQIDGGGGHDSVIQCLYEIFLRHYQAFDGVSEGLGSYSLFVATISGLSSLIMKPGGKQALAEHVAMMNQQRSIYRTVITDGSTSGADFVERKFSGVAPLISFISDELIAATGLPYYKIKGSESNTNSLSHGGAESRAYAEQVQSWQMSEMHQGDRRLLKMLFQASSGTIPDFEIEYPSIYTPTPDELADINKKEADRYSVLISAQVIQPLEAKLAIASGQPIDNILSVEDVQNQMKAPQPALVTQESDRSDDASPAKRVIKWNGFQIGLQYFPFDKRHGRVLQSGYGYFRKTKGADGMAVDVYVGPRLESPKIFVIDQFIKSQFDEEKMVIGVDDIASAIAIYTAAMPTEMIGGVREITLEQLQAYRVGHETKADNRYSHIDFVPPAAVQKSFQRALNADGAGKLKVDSISTESKELAKRMADGGAITPGEVYQGHQFFQCSARYDKASKDSFEWASWALWGYSQGRAWINKLWRQMESSNRRDESEIVTTEGEILSNAEWEVMVNVGEEDILKMIEGIVE